MMNGQQCITFVKIVKQLISVYTKIYDVGENPLTVDWPLAIEFVTAYHFTNFSWAYTEIDDFRKNPLDIDWLTSITMILKVPSLG